MSDTSIPSRIEDVLESVRPALKRHRGDVELVAWLPDEGVVQVRFHGTCVGCPLSGMTLKMGIEAALTDAIPSVREVIAVE